MVGSTKFLFTIVIDGQIEFNPGMKLHDDARKNANKVKRHQQALAPLEQIGFYQDPPSHPRGLFTGVADKTGFFDTEESYRLLDLDGEPIRVPPGRFPPPAKVMEAFFEPLVAAIVDPSNLDLPEGCPINYTWGVVSLPELDNGCGDLHLEGMAGINGGGC